MDKYNQSLQWAKQNLLFKEVVCKTVAKTSYSIVYQIKISNGVFYLKITPKDLFSEPLVINILNKQGCDNLPQIVAVNNDLNCFLMNTCGDISLRNLFREKIDLGKLNQGISNYTKIQRSQENNIFQLLSLGVPDWRLDKFALLYRNLIQQEKLLLDDGLTKQELDQLHVLYPKCVQLCNELSKYKIPETINHCDFHDNNMLLEFKTGKVNIIDWGEAVIAHPFFSLQGFLWNMIYFHKLKKNDFTYKKLQLKCIQPWLDLHDEKTLLNAFNIAGKLNGVYAALGFERIYTATKDLTKKVKDEHRGSIAGCLKSFTKVNALRDRN